MLDYLICLWPLASISNFVSFRTYTVYCPIKPSALIPAFPFPDSGRLSTSAAIYMNFKGSITSYDSI